MLLYKAAYQWNYKQSSHVIINNGLILTTKNNSLSKADLFFSFNFFGVLFFEWDEAFHKNSFFIILYVCVKISQGTKPSGKPT